MGQQNLLPSTFFSTVSPVKLTTTLIHVILPQSCLFRPSPHLSQVIKISDTGDVSVSKIICQTPSDMRYGTKYKMTFQYHIG